MDFDTLIEIVRQDRAATFAAIDKASDATSAAHAKQLIEHLGRLSASELDAIEAVLVEAHGAKPDTKGTSAISFD